LQRFCVRESRFSLYKTQKTLALRAQPGNVNTGARHELCEGEMKGWKAVLVARVLRIKRLSNKASSLISYNSEYSRRSV
jgi:hypothetical protein